jgi:hypothetical protein
VEVHVIMLDLYYVCVKSLLKINMIGYLVLAISGSVGVFALLSCLIHCIEPQYSPPVSPSLKLPIEIIDEKESVVMI